MLMLPLFSFPYSSRRLNRCILCMLCISRCMLFSKFCPSEFNRCAAATEISRKGIKVPCVSFVVHELEGRGARVYKYLMFPRWSSLEGSHSAIGCSHCRVVSCRYVCIFVLEKVCTGCTSETYWIATVS